MLLKTLVSQIQETKPLPDNFLKSILDESDRKPQQTRLASYSGYTHVSSLANNFCPRQYAISIEEKLNLHESLTGGHKVTFAIGRAVEQHVRESFIESYGRHNIYAKWLCPCGKKYYEGLGLTVTCQCGKSVDIFSEPDIVDEENAIKGHPDLVFRYDKSLHVVEIKSIKADAWNDLESPLSSHIKQANLYPYLLSKKTGNVSPVVTFLYVTKDFKFGSPYKEFRIDTNSEENQKIRAEMLAEAKQVKDYVSTRQMPERICSSLASNLAKKCPMAFRCFHQYD